MRQGLRAVIDMHSHMLPGVDDGARDEPEGLQMLRMAAADGVGVQVLTPHIHFGMYPNTKDSLQARFEVFRERARESDIPVELRLAAEVRIGAEVLPLVASGGVPCLGHWNGMRVLLLEFPHNQVPVGSLKLVAWLARENVLAMIAHPERNRELQSDTAKLDPFVGAGCLLQITAGSLTGRFGALAQRASHKLLRAGSVALLATDCHNLAYRPPVLSEGFEAAVSLVGESAALSLVLHNPCRLLGLESGG